MKRIVFSTSGVNRYGYRVLTLGIKIKGDVPMFFGHNTHKFPIGKWTDIKIEGDVLSGVPVFDEVTEDSKTCKLLYEKGTLNACSIGFNVISSTDDPALALKGQRYETITSCDLLEVSLVGIPANPDATVMNLDFSLDVNVPLLNLKSVKMDLKNIALKLGLLETSSEADILAVLDKRNDSEVMRIVQLGMDKGVVTESNLEFYTNAVKKDSETWELHFSELGAPVAQMPVAAPASQTVAPATTSTTQTQMTLAQRIWANRPAAGVVATTVGNGAEGQLGWSYQDWQKNDAEGLKQLMFKDHRFYDELVAKAMVD